MAVDHRERANFAVLWVPQRRRGAALIATKEQGSTDVTPAPSEGSQSDAPPPEI